jgi:hypothetical protein
VFQLPGILAQGGLRNTVAPEVTGIPLVGQVLTCSTGTWSPTPTSYTYQWLRDGASIAGATANTHTLVSADEGTVVSCRVTAIKSGDSKSATSNAIGPVAGGAKFVGSMVGAGAHSSGQLTLNFALTGGLDTVPRTGDIVFVCSGIISAASGDIDTTPITAGYTAISDLYSDDTNNANLGLAYKVMGASPDTNVIVKCNTDTNYASGYSIHVWRGINVAGGPSIPKVEITGINSGIVDPPAIVGSAGSIIFVAGCGAFAYAGSAFTSADLDHFVSGNGTTSTHGTSA